MQPPVLDYAKEMRDYAHLTRLPESSLERGAIEHMAQCLEQCEPPPAPEKGKGKRWYEFSGKGKCKLPVCVQECMM